MFFRRQRRRQKRFPAAPFPAIFHGDGARTILLVETGVGATAVANALSWLLDCPPIDGVLYRPSLVVSAGFSGAVVSDLNVGDLVIGNEVCDRDENCWPTTWPPAAGRFRSGRLLTVPFIVGRPEQKRRVGEQTGAVAVDMETAVVARLCSKAGVPFGCVRAVSDDMDTPLSESLLTVLQGGAVRPARLLTAILQRPSLIVELMRLGANTRKAAGNLAAGLEELLRLG